MPTRVRERFDPPALSAGKRLFDVVVASILILLLSPILLVLTVWIPLDSTGSPFYFQVRRGFRGYRYRMFKFRTMTKQADAMRATLVSTDRADRLLFKLKHDPRVTRLGRFLRKYSFDELPQLFNVLRGDMSLVGPRPLISQDFEKVNDSSPLFQLWLRKRQTMLPGITGLWQVSGRNELSFDELMRLDIHYVETWSLWLDLKILFRTFSAVLKHQGAY